MHFRSQVFRINDSQTVIPKYSDGQKLNRFIVILSSQELSRTENISWAMGSFEKIQQIATLKTTI